ncbi:hypothetical protein ABZ904_08570 [Streptomyces sp. NPDC046900]|uniref:hypothetical protein n=1 Tax=Streptomyces sp. NPDC046900 TaxID=3155473 RepID=UPI0033E95E60
MDEPGRYRVTLTVEDQRVMDGWWDSEAIARKKWATTVGQYGRDGSHVILVDTETDQELATWPKPAASPEP